MECAHISLIEPPRRIKRRGDSHLHNIHAAQSITCRLLFSRGKQARGMRFRWSSGAVDAAAADTLFFLLPRFPPAGTFYQASLFPITQHNPQHLLASAKWIAHLPVSASPARWNRPSRAGNSWRAPTNNEGSNYMRTRGTLLEALICTILASPYTGLRGWKVYRRQESSNLTGFISSIQTLLIAQHNKRVWGVPSPRDSNAC